MEQNKKYAVGIDLGTTYSCVGIWQNGKVEIVPNEQGNRTTPSWVAYTKQERLVGEAAKNQASRNFENTIYDAKRIMGKKFNEIPKKSYNFTIIDKNNDPYFEVMYKDEKKQIKAEEVSSAILQKMKKIVDEYLGLNDGNGIKDVVITVPAYFNDSQRQATKDAGLIAGLNVLRIINEPTAAAIAYGMDKSLKKEQNVIVFDCGGGTHDVSLLNIDDGVFEVKATSGDTFLGGRDFDNKIVDHCIQEFKKKTGVDVSNNKKAKNRLMEVCERAKLALTSSTQTSIEIDSLAEGQDFSLTLTRAYFEQMCAELFQKTLKPVEDVLMQSNLSKNQIDEVILVGGSTRIPKIQELLTNYFNGKALCKSINPDEAVAYGATVQAAILQKIDDKKLDEMVLIDIIPLDIGIETSGEIMEPILERGSKKPNKKTKTFSTYSDNQPGVSIRIFEGQRKLTKDNHLLGNFQLDGIAPAPRGVPQIEITMDIDADGILKVSALEKTSGKSHEITIKNDNKLSTSDIEKMINEAEKYKDDDKKVMDRIDAKNHLENYCYSVKTTMNDEKYKDKVTEEEKTNVLNKVNSIQQEMNSYKDKSEFETKQKELEELYNPISKKIYGDNPPGNMPGMNPNMNMEELMKQMGGKEKVEEMMKQMGGKEKVEEMMQQMGKQQEDKPNNEESTTNQELD